MLKAEPLLLSPLSPYSERQRQLVTRYYIDSRWIINNFIFNVRITSVYLRFIPVFHWNAGIVNIYSRLGHVETFGSRRSKP